MAGAASSLLAADLEACCRPVTSGAIDAGAATRLAQAFRALADPTRVRLLSLIAAHAGGRACVCELTKPVGLSQPTVSHHMKQLVDAGLVRRDQCGKWAYYSVDKTALNALAAALQQRD
ncbi:MAG: ArsR/SmtB family transcription factor [Streptosporangiales bacterium]